MLEAVQLFGRCSTDELLIQFARLRALLAAALLKQSLHFGVLLVVTQQVIHVVDSLLRLAFPLRPFHEKVNYAPPSTHDRPASVGASCDFVKASGYSRLHVPTLCAPPRTIPALSPPRYMYHPRLGKDASPRGHKGGSRRRVVERERANSMTQPRNPPTRAAFLSPARHNFGVPDFDVICFLITRHFCDFFIMAVYESRKRGRPSRASKEIDEAAERLATVGLVSPFISSRLQPEVATLLNEADGSGCDSFEGKRASIENPTPTVLVQAGVQAQLTPLSLSSDTSAAPTVRATPTVNHSPWFEQRSQQEVAMPFVPFARSSGAAVRTQPNLKLDAVGSKQRACFMSQLTALSARQSKAQGVSRPVESQEGRTLMES